MYRTVSHKNLKKQYDIFTQTDEFELLISELEFSTLLLPMDEETHQVPIINFEDEYYIPLFTDIHEFEKVDFGDDLTVTANNFEVYLDLLDSEINGLIIDLEGMRFPITSEMKEGFSTYPKIEKHNVSIDEIKKIKSSIDNSDLDEFLSHEENFWDYERLLDWMLKSDIFCVGLSLTDISEGSDNGIIRVDHHMPNAVHQEFNESYALIYSSESEIKPKDNPLYPYAQLVNLRDFIFNVLHEDLDGILLNENSQSIIIPREFLFEFIEGQEMDDPKIYDEFAFVLGD